MPSNRVARHQALNDFYLLNFLLTQGSGLLQKDSPVAVLLAFCLDGCCDLLAVCQLTVGRLFGWFVTGL